MRAYLTILGFFLLTGYQSFGQLYFPNVHFYNSETERYFFNHEEEQTYFNSHMSMRPLLDKRTNRDSIFFKDTKHYIWLTQKLFKENVLIFEGEDFWCAVDPILDLELGTDFSADSLSRLYWNTRGLRVQARFFDKVAFSTVFYENQAFVPEYVMDYVDQAGELRPAFNNYVQENAVIPGYARTKSFKTTGYDFAFAEGTVSIVPNEHINVQFGNGNQFIGNGYRSLLLSDFAPNYPFAKFEGNFWKNRIQYNAIYAIHQNLYRLPLYTSVEATYERKIGTYHYLDFAITPKIHVGLFEGALWRRSDSLGSYSPNWLFTNPVPFVNAAVMNGNDSTYNHILGVNFSWTFLKNRLYGQAILDHGFGGFQLGIKSYDLFTPKLDAMVEFNMATNNTYLADNKRYNYSHNNIALAHPLNTNFEELIFQINYEKKEFFVSNRTIFNRFATQDSSQQKVSLVNDNLNQVMITAGPARTLINNLELGYRFNKNYNLQAVIGWTFRNGYGDIPNTHTNYVYAGIRTRLRNKTLDF